MGKGELAHNEQFLLFPRCFLRNQIIVSSFVHIFDIISLFAAEYKKPEIGISGRGLKLKVTQLLIGVFIRIFLCPRVERLGTYCFTGVCLSFCLSVCPSVSPKLNVKFTISLLLQNYPSHVWFEST